MRLPEPLTRGTLLRRYKRFLADVVLENGQTIVAHCPNPGSMIGCAEPGSPVWLRYSADPRRKLPYTWVMTLVGKTCISVDTLLANRVVHEALQEEALPGLKGYSAVRPEFCFGDSRFDFCLLKGETPACLIEVKSTTLAENEVAMFPDAKTVRGRKHLQGLMAARRQGLRAVQFYCIVRDDIAAFAPAAHVDPDYAATLKEAAAAGVEVMAWALTVTADQGGGHSVRLVREIPALF